MILKENKKFGSKGNTYFNIFRKYCEKKFLIDTHAKMSQNMLAYSFVSEHSNYFFFILRKILHV